MKVRKSKERQELEIKFTGTAQQLLSRFGINPETVIVAVNGTIVGLDHVLKDSDEVTLFSVISGG